MVKDLQGGCTGIPVSITCMLEQGQGLHTKQCGSHLVGTSVQDHGLKNRHLNAREAFTARSVQAYDLLQLLRQPQEQLERRSSLALSLNTRIEIKIRIALMDDARTAVKGGANAVKGPKHEKENFRVTTAVIIPSRFSTISMYMYAKRVCVVHRLAEDEGRGISLGDVAGLIKEKEEEEDTDVVYSISQNVCVDGSQDRCGETVVEVLRLQQWAVGGGAGGVCQTEMGTC